MKLKNLFFSAVDRKDREIIEENIVTHINLKRNPLKYYLDYIVEKMG